MVNVTDIPNIPINGSDIMNQVSGNLTGVLSDVFSPVMGILKAVGIAFLISLVVLILRAFSDMKMKKRIGKITESVEDINKKLDKIIKK